jgi:hypothetical protein
MLPWMGEEFLSGARRMVRHGPSAADSHLIASARAVPRNGACGPTRQSPVAPLRADEETALRIRGDRSAHIKPDGLGS